jgi:hypothetical protein
VEHSSSRLQANLTLDDRKRSKRRITLLITSNPLHDRRPRAAPLVHSLRGRARGGNRGRTPRGGSAAGQQGILAAVRWHGAMVEYDLYTLRAQMILHVHRHIILQLPAAHI